MKNQSKSRKTEKSIVVFSGGPTIVQNWLITQCWHLVHNNQNVRLNMGFYSGFSQKTNIFHKKHLIRKCKILAIFSCFLIFLLKWRLPLPKIYCLEKYFVKNSQKNSWPTKIARNFSWPTKIDRNFSWPTRITLASPGNTFWPVPYKKGLSTKIHVHMVIFKKFTPASPGNTFWPVPKFRKNKCFVFNFFYF